MKARCRRRSFSAVTVLMAGWLLVPRALPLEEKEFAGSAHGYPAFRDLSGRTLGDGEFLQWIEDGRLHIRITYRFPDGRRIEENGVLRQKPQIVQDAWWWRESRGGETLREFKVDFGAQTATAQKRDKGELKHWEEKVEIEPGRTFAGFGFTIALQNLRARLLKGERIELKAVGFRPQPQVVTVELSHAGVERMKMSGRIPRGDRFVIHPEIPALAKFFVKVPDTYIWLTHPAPAGFLRWEGPVAEPNDTIVRVDLLPGEGSGPAEPATDNDSD